MSAMTAEKETNHAFVRSISNARLSTSHACNLQHGCDWELIGEYRISMRGVLNNNMPADSDGTVKYNTYRCRRCGRTQSDEVMYSFEPNVKITDSPPKNRTKEL